MRHRSTTRGFTIIEVLIFLVVSSFVFTAAISQYTSQQHRVEYNQGVRGLQADLLNIISEVSSSFEPDISAYQCSADNINSDITISSPATAAGNSDCVFLGQALVFGGDGTGNYCTSNTAGQCSHYTVIPIAGRRQYYPPSPGVVAGIPVNSLSQARPFALASCTTDTPLSPTLYSQKFPCGTTPVPPSPFHPDKSVTKKFSQNIAISKAFIRNVDGSFNRSIGGFAFIFDLAGSDALSLDNVSSVDLVSLDRAGAPLPFQDNTLSKSIAAITNLNGATAAQINPPYGIALCTLNDFGMKTIITIGASQSQLDVQVEPENSPNMTECPS